MAQMTRQDALDSINCIERVCCPPASTQAGERADFLWRLAGEENVEVIGDGPRMVDVAVVAAEFHRLGLAFCNRELTDAAAQLASHPGRLAS